MDREARAPLNDRKARKSLAEAPWPALRGYNVYTRGVNPVQGMEGMMSYRGPFPYIHQQIQIRQKSDRERGACETETESGEMDFSSCI